MDTINLFQVSAIEEMLYFENSSRSQNQHELNQLHKHHKIQDL